MRKRVVGLVAFALTAGALASASASRIDPPYDDDRALSEEASRTYHFQDETDVTVPVVQCEMTSESPGVRGAVAIVVGRRHLGVEGREVMSFSPDPRSDIELHSSGTTLLPLAMGLQYQARVAEVAGKTLTHADLYLDESMPWSEAQSVIATVNVSRGLVVRDARSNDLRLLVIEPFRGLSCGDELVRHLTFRNGSLIDEDGAVVDGATYRKQLAPTRWALVLHVVDDPPFRSVASALATLDLRCSGAPEDHGPTLYLDVRTSAEVREDTLGTSMKCAVRPPPRAPP